MALPLFIRQNRQSGQVGIVLLLLTVVLLSAGVSIVNRSVTDVNISNTASSGEQAFDLAESAIDQANSQDLSTYTPPAADPSNPIQVRTNVSGNRSLSAYIAQGDVASIDVTGMAAGSVLSVSWAKETVCTETASLVFSVFNTAGGSTPGVRRYYMGPASCSRGDNFTPATAGSGSYFNQATITLQTGDVLLRIRPLYAASDILVSGANLPVQSYTVTSVAQNTISKETKAVRLQRTLPAAPSLFDYVLFSGTSITQ